MFILLRKKAHNIRSILSKKLSILYPNISFHWLELDHIPNGQLLSAAEAIQDFEVEDDFLVHNCDTSFDFNLEALNSLLSRYPKCYSIVPVFNAPGDHWSFVKTSHEDGRVATELSEKKRISSNCSIGAYYFSASSEFLRDVRDYLSFLEEKCYSGELYIAPFINFMLQEKSKKVLVMPAPIIDFMALQKNSAHHAVFQSMSFCLKMQGSTPEKNSNC